MNEIAATCGTILVIITSFIVQPVKSVAYGVALLLQKHNRLLAIAPTYELLLRSLLKYVCLPFVW